jgi:hypothetical protein
MFCKGLLKNHHASEIFKEQLDASIRDKTHADTCEIGIGREGAFSCSRQQRTEYTEE